jgi:hypothetical protein
MTIYSYRTSRNKMIELEISTNSCGVQRNENKKKGGQLVPISSLLNLNIRIADIVMIQWVRSTYFSFIDF